MKDTILIDFDSVIRHWASELIDTCEKSNGLNRGSLFSVAFSSELLNNAITLLCSHTEWVERVQHELSTKFGAGIAKALVDSWEQTEASIDYDFLYNIRMTAPTAKLVLVTNATSRLASDLKIYNLEQSFEHVINSSEIGVAKPNRQFFERTFGLLNLKPRNGIFLDDTLKNVEASREFEIKSLHHKSVVETLAFIKENCI